MNSTSSYTTLIYIDPNEVPQITSWEMEAALRDVKNGTATGNDHISIDTLKLGDDTISMIPAKLYIRCFSENE